MTRDIGRGLLTVNMSAGNMSVLTPLCRSRGLLVLSVATVVLSHPASAQARRGVQDTLNSVDRIVARELERQGLPGLQVAVGANGRVVYSHAVGKADVENGVPLTPASLIRTGSIAKSISAVAAMMLVEAGRLDLDAPVQRYCNAFPTKPWPITTRELLSHTSGIRHYRGTEPDNTTHYARMADGFAIFANDSLLFQPGSHFSYSTYGYTVVGCVIEGASGQSFYDYVREHVLIAAGMTHTVVDDIFAILPHRAHGYHGHRDSVANAGLMDGSYKIPGGGLVSTADDLVRFGMALMSGKLLKRETLDLMWTPTRVPVLDGGQPSTYGLGFEIVIVDGQKVVSHSGGQQGTTTHLVMIPGRSFAVATMANDDQAAPWDVSNAILDFYRMPRQR
ncbi:MAG TPA: serine hydrolase domain-containing protein [Gemmatimonadaceae bacterium]|jgi:CubicO group peptidase (beta-lactamase class C family)|nr:serine hydrolase domain-containing protein [Gemmatimonadaceae bacterium]